jgi:hypothetical protein
MKPTRPSPVPLSIPEIVWILSLPAGLAAFHCFTANFNSSIEMVASEMVGGF